MKHCKFVCYMIYSFCNNIDML